MAEGTQSSRPSVGSSTRSTGLQILEERGARRPVLVRKLLIHAPLALAFGAVSAAALYYAFTNSLGALVGSAIFGLPAFAFGYEAFTAARDLRAQPMITRGRIARMWNKGTILWMTRAYYLLVDQPVAEGAKPKQRFFVISHEAYLQLEEGRTVELEHWPHTNTVLSLGLLESTRSARSTRPN